MLSVLRVFLMYIYARPVNHKFPCEFPLDCEANCFISRINYLNVYLNVYILWVLKRRRSTIDDNALLGGVLHGAYPVRK